MGDMAREPVTEVVALVAKPGSEDALEQAVRDAIPLFRASTGTNSMVLRREVEDPSHYTLSMGWDHLDDHLVGFRQSDVFGQWRAMVTPHLAEPPRVVHQHEVLTGF